MTTTELTFEEAETLVDVLIRHGMDEPHDGHAEWDCRADVRRVVNGILAARAAHLGAKP